MCFSPTKICGKVVQGRVPNGPPGLIVPLCFTIVPQQGKAVQLFAIVAAGVSGRVGVDIRYTTLANTQVANFFLKEASAVTRTVSWKLL